MSDYIVTTEQATVYKVRRAPDAKNRFGWADAAVRSWPRGGQISVQSDFGTYAAGWSATGDGPFLAFLVSLDFDYFMGKAKPGYMEFDSEKTIAGIKRTIIEQRRGRWASLTKERARECWDDLELYGADSTASDTFFLSEILRSDALAAIFDGDYAGALRKSPDPQAVGFWKEIWPALCEVWRAEIMAAAA